MVCSSTCVMGHSLNSSKVYSTESKKIIDGDSFLLFYSLYLACNLNAYGCGLYFKVDMEESGNSNNKKN